MAEDTVRQELQKARNLIKDKQYPEARHILEKINHPTAKKWLSELEQVDTSWVDELPEMDWDALEASPPLRSTIQQVDMKKQYTGLIDSIKLIAVLVFSLGVIATIGAGLNPYGGGLGTAIVIFVSATLVALLFNAVAAGLDLMATIELNIRKTAIYFDRRTK